MGNKLDGVTARYPQNTFPNWMESLPDETLISDLSIPGTHGSISCYGMHNECQHWPLYSQLKAGVRFIDIGCRHYGRRFTFHEGTNYQNTMFEPVCEEVAEFLKEHSSETVLFHVREEAIPYHTSQPIVDSLEQSISKCRRQTFKGGASSLGMITLGQVRGKMVFLVDFDGVLLEPYTSINVVGKKSIVRSLSDLDIGKKWDELQTNLTKAIDGKAEDAFLTMSGGNCGFTHCPSPYAICGAIHDHLDRYLKGLDGKRQRLGIIAMDFPREDLIQAIIKTNNIELL
ncbi:1-phosphatidylinositol phosphodiesterase-like [Glandiceps talaboti]